MSLKNRGGRQDYGRSYPAYDPSSLNTRRSTRRNARKNRRRRRGIAGPVILICAVVAVLVAADFLVNSGRIHRGVEVGSVALGGQTPAGARDIIEDRALGPLKEIEFSGPERFTRTSEEMGVDFNVDATVEKAFAVGREGNVLDRFSQRLRAVFGGVTIPPDVDYRPRKAEAEIGEIASRVNREPREADVKIYGSEVEVTESRDGYKLDPAATMKSVDGAIDGMSGEAKLAGKVLKPEITTSEAEKAAEKAGEAVSEQVVLTAEGRSWILSPADLGSILDVSRKNGDIDVGVNRDRLKGALSTVATDMTVEPKEASYDFADDGSVVVNPGRDGKAIDADKLAADIEGGMFGGKRQYPISIITDEPELTTAEAEQMKPTELLGSYRTNYEIVEDPDGTRAENLEIASGAVNGILLAPGDYFSMIYNVGGYDYNETKVIVQGKETTEAGGGLCQVTSTLYNAVLYAGLDVVDRWPHMAQLPYIRPGLDATIWWGSPGTADDVDMQFQNTSEGYIRIEEYVSDDGYVYANVYGVPDDIDVKLWSEPAYRDAESAQWVTYMTKTDNGQVVYDGELHTDEYTALTSETGEKFPADEVPIANVNGTPEGQ